MNAACYSHVWEFVSRPKKQTRCFRNVEASAVGEINGLNAAALDEVSSCFPDLVAHIVGVVPCSVDIGGYI